MDRPEHFVINDCGSYYTIENIKANDFDNFHTHINKKAKGSKSKDTCKLLIKLICNKTIPNSKYLQTSAIRLSRDDKYILNILNKQNKNRNKQRFYKVNNGPR